MSGFDGAVYERRLMDRIRALGLTLREHPGFVLDSYGRGPIVNVSCAKGHRLVQIYGDPAAHHPYITMMAVPEQKIGRRGAIVRADEPWKSPASRCPQEGCGARVHHHGYCDVHGGGEFRDIGTMRTRFICRVNGCGWDQPITTATLLEKYALAVHTGTSNMRLDTPDARGKAVTR